MLKWSFCARTFLNRPLPRLGSCVGGRSFTAAPINVTESPFSCFSARPRSTQSNEPVLRKERHFTNDSSTIHPHPTPTSSLSLLIDERARVFFLHADVPLRLVLARLGLRRGAEGQPPLQEDVFFLEDGAAKGGKTAKALIRKIKLQPYKEAFEKAPSHCWSRSVSTKQWRRGSSCCRDKIMHFRTGQQCNPLSAPHLLSPH